MNRSQRGVRQGIMAGACAIALSLGGCDYWPPALLAQLEQLRSTVQDLSDERAQLEAQLREATLLREEMQGRLNEVSRENEELKQKLARLESALDRRQQNVARRADSSPSRRVARTAGAKPGGRLLALQRPLMRGEDVKAVQRALKDLGLPVRVDGYYGHDTKAAVRWFQRKHGLRADGVIGPKTRALIERKSVFADGRILRLKRPRVTGSDVRRVQRALREAGFPVSVDGTYGKRTRAAVKRFQRQHGLRADGVVGPATYEALAAS